MTATLLPHKRNRGALLFSGVMMLSALIFQRFGLTAGTSFLDAVAPIGMGIAGIFLMTGTLVFHRQRLLIFMILSFLILTNASIGALFPNDYGVASTPSLCLFLFLTSFATVTFAQPVAEKDFFRVVNAALAVVASAGLFQFFAQFARLELFTFAPFIPNRFLVEDFWHVLIPIEGTTLFKSNGFFLLEPSLFSQYTALALLIEILVLQRLSYLCLFGTALISSVSGTGWLMIMGFVLTAVISLGGRGIIMAAATMAVGVVALGGLALASPDIYHFLIARTDEFSSPGSSGHLRFVTPWWLASDILQYSPDVFFLGLGAGISEHPRRVLSYDYTVNSTVKLLLEFGAPAFIAFVSLFFVGHRSRVQNALIAPIVVWVFWDGGNVETPFVLLPALLLLVTPDLRSEA